MRSPLLGHQLMFALAVVLIGAAGFSEDANGQAVSQPAILQMFEARWETIEERMADIHQVGYGSMWVPPVGKAGSVFSAGYDVFDRFDLGTPGNETHYGTEDSFKNLVGQANRASVDIYPDLIINHNGFGNRTDSTFVAQGGYPGFALTLPGVDIDGDYHSPFLDWTVDPVNGQLFGLNDIAQEKNHLFYRHPITPGDPDNIPAGTIWNKPDANKTRFYPDQGLGGTSVYDPELGQNVTLYDFNTSDPFQGDPVIENSVGLLMRNVRWLIQEFGVSGFRVDAAKHSPEFTLDYMDQAVFRAIQDLQHDGSYKPVFMFSEIADGNKGYVQSFIRQDLPNPHAISPANTTVGGNRDALDFPLFWAMKDNLTGNGTINNWHNIRAASMDTNDRPGGSDVWHTDGSQGVAFVQSHDDTGAYLENVAYAYTLMRPGNALVYLNAEEYGSTSFPQPGKDDALGGYYGNTITKLVDIRNSHGRGDFQERWLDDAFNPNGFSNVYVYERSNSAIVGLNSRNDSQILTRTVGTNFTAGDVLVELTGNAADSTIDPNGVIPEVIRINGSGQATISVPANAGHGRGYVIYGPATPQGSLVLNGVSTVLAGETPSAGYNGTDRLADIHVISSPTFDVRLSTSPVTLPAPAGESNPVREYDADGDNALFRIDDGYDLNGNTGIDYPTPGSVNYGFEEFTDTNVPGYIDDGFGVNIGSGAGNYIQTIDASQLSEGRHYLTARAFRHRDPGETEIFKDFKETIYVDLLDPDSEVLSFEPFPAHPLDTQDRDLIVRNPDGTANEMHMFLDLPANLTDAEILQLVQGGADEATQYDRDVWQRDMLNVSTGNHTATIVTIEPTGTAGIERVAGLYTFTRLGAGFGDLDSSRTLDVSDILGIGNGSFEDVLYSQNDLFNAAADIDGNGLVDTLDLLELKAELIAGGAGQSVLDAYDQLLIIRADVNDDGQTNSQDITDLYAAFGQSGWYEDLNVDGTVNEADVEMLIDDLVRTSWGDFDLDQTVSGSDFLIWQLNAGSGPGARFNQGDADLNGFVTQSDLNTWESEYGVQSLGSVVATVPEPCSAILLLGVLGCVCRIRLSHVVRPVYAN